MHAAQALAVLRGREYVLTQDVHTIAKDVLRHRLVLSYQAMVEEVAADDVLDRILKVVPWPRLEVDQRSA